MEPPIVAFFDEVDFDLELTRYSSFIYPHIGEEVRIAGVSKAVNGMYIVKNVRFVLEDENPTPFIIVILSRESKSIAVEPADEPADESIVNRLLNGLKYG